MKLDHAAVLAGYDAQVRRGTQPDGSGSSAVRARPVVCWTSSGGSGWSGIAWSDLDPGTADEVIADQIRFFGARGERFEWKLYGYDRPADLSQRLLAEGFVPGEPEALMVAEAAGLVGARLPSPTSASRTASAWSRSRTRLLSGRSSAQRFAAVHRDGRGHGR